MKICIRPVEFEDVTNVAALIEEAFAAGIAPHYSDEGCVTFRHFATASRIRARLLGESESWVAVDDDAAIVGYLEMSGDHVRMLFTRPDRQRLGIGRRLLEHVLGRHPNRDVTVNSAPDADGFYLQMGFLPAGPKKEERGIVFTPMIRPADPALPAPQPQGSGHRR